MENIKIAFFEIQDWEKEYLARQLKDVEVSFFAEKLSLENVDLAKDANIISVFIYSQITRKIF